MVYFIGFLCGLAYLGGLPEVLRVPRLATPRTLVPAGSVGLAGGQANAFLVMEYVEGQTLRALSEELFVIDSKLGRLTIAKKDVRAISFYKPTPEELADYEFKTAMKRLDQLGLDVILVIDTTDSMVGVLRRLREREGIAKSRMR